MLTIPALGSFDESNWAAIASAFQNAPRLVMGQAWYPEPVKNFRPAEVRVGWRDDSIHVFARLEDDDVFTNATADHQMMWDLGDVLEIFLRDAEREDYVELHTTPAGYRLQIRFPSALEVHEVRADRRAAEEFMIFEPVFDFRVREVSGGWEMAARVPYQVVNPEISSPAGRQVWASFSRYDYARDGEEPVISSTSPHAEEDFHRQQEWRMLRFEP